MSGVGDQIQEPLVHLAQVRGDAVQIWSVLFVDYHPVFLQVRLNQDRGRVGPG